jgi:predicted acylesterase/phospholipase RssA/CO dehydrogenase nickel-insertion accessory protein CooC1
MIYTFYSFKGGVGRSMALANVARWFYDRGLKVLMVDWDLEAPGLEAFFESKTADGKGPAPGEGAEGRPGVIDMLLQYKRVHPRLPLPVRPRAGDKREGAPARDALAVLDEHLSPIRGMLYAVYASAEGREGSLYLLPAGLRAGDNFADYARAVQSFDWADFYELFHGEAYFNWLRKQLGTVADVVLIDARTGVTEMGGVCARQLADVVVSFCAPNDQNLKGVRTMVRSFLRKDVEQVRLAPLEVVLVPARVDRQDSQQFEQFEQEFNGELFAEVRNPFQSFNRGFWDLKIPYITKYAYKEDLAISQTTGVGKELGDAYRTLAVHLVLLAPEGSLLRRMCAHAVQERYPQLIPTIAVAYAGATGREAEEEIRQRIVAHGNPVWQGNGDVESPQLASVLPYLRHLVFAVADGSPDSDALRKLWHESRRLGVWTHYVRTSRAKPPAAKSDVPPPAWLRRAQVHSADDLATLLSALGTRTPAPRVPHMAPLPPSNFVNRAEFGMLKAALLASSAAPLGIALWGMGGSGKTVLAAAACNDEEVRASFEGGVLWASLGAEADLATQLEAMAGLLSEPAAHAATTGTGPRDPRPTPGLNNVLTSLVSLTAERPTLVVLDDVTGGEQVKPILNRCRFWTVLLTTRDRSTADEVQAQVIPLGAMSRDEARALLTPGLGLLSAADLRHVETIRQAAASLPLALALARGQLQRFGRADQPPGAVLASVASAFETEMPFVGDNSVATTIANCLRRLPDRVQGYVASVARLPGEVTLTHVQRDLNFSPTEGLAFARLLRDCALAQFDEPAGVLLIHPLVRAYFAQPAAAEPRASAVDAVRDILRGKEVPVEEMLNLAIQLRQESRFGLARRLLQKAHGNRSVGRLAAAKQLRLVQQLALCTYKDPDLPAFDRLDRALEILEQDADLASSTNPETLGLAGAVHKRKWEVDAQKQHLEDALAYYLRGHRAARPGLPDYDFGYTAINASFLLDLLADLEDASPSAGGAGAADGPAARRLQAQRIREELCVALPPILEGSQQWLRRTWWFYATLAEAFFGVRRYDDARDWIAQGRAVCFVPDWELESTSRQLAALARLSPHAGPTRDEPSKAATAVLRDLLDGSEQALRRTLVGKVGLALSGGGFRASLFHIGVLARLAELDVLRSVEVLSCVSGGSIIGAQYYLEVRRLLQSKADHEITREDYVAIVQRISADFLAGVQTNIRTSVAAHWRTSLRMIFDAGYSRTERLAELYEERLFKRVPDGEGDKARYMNDLYIHPLGEESFDPKTRNWRRAAKVPVLVLNATTLNTGHNWQFTASFMGEPPSRIDTRVDGNERLRRMYYHEAPASYRRVRLGRAVAASACVPGLFEPLVLRDLYPDRLVRLVDGGVHDNQGVGALLEQDCTVLLVSDASGQMQTLSSPTAGLFGVPLRANGILQARLRVAQYQELDARRRSALLRGLMFIHLRKDLDVEPINWVNCDDPVEAAGDVRPAALRGGLTRYGIRKDVQEKLANVRTDLDSFSDLEAYALMVSGYCMTKYEFGECVTGFPEPKAERPIWPFLRVEEEMRHREEAESKHNRLMATLEIASRSGFKLWTVPPGWRAALGAAGLLLLLGLVYLLLSLGLSLNWPWALAGTGTVAVVAWLVYRFRSRVGGFAFRCALYGLGTVPAWLHVRIFDRSFLAAGRVEGDLRDRLDSPANRSPQQRPSAG